ncbi:unnamed protein product, partial [marine sediment metagenome]
MAVIGVCFLLGGLLSPVWAGSKGKSPVAPYVEITSPAAEFPTNAGEVTVTVHFKADANPTDKKEKATGNVKTIILLLNGKEVARFENKPNVKEDTIDFTVDISGIVDQAIVFAAQAFQGNVNAGGAATSVPVPVIVDRTAPALDQLTPAPESFVPTAKPTISTRIIDALAGVDAATLVMKLDGNPVAAAFADNVLSFTPQADLAEGEHTVAVTAKDTAGNEATAAWTFAVDTEAPVL